MTLNTTVARPVYQAALEVIRDRRIGVLCPKCHGTAARLLLEDDVVVGIECGSACGKDGIIFGRRPYA